MDWLQERLKFELGLLDYPVFNLAGTPITVATLVVFATIIGATFLVSYLIQKVLAKGLRLR